MSVEWQRVPLGDIVDIFDGARKPVKATDRIPGSIPYCGANGVIDEIDGYTHEGEFVLLAEDGGLFGPGERSSYMMKGRFWANNHVHILRGKDQSVLSSYLHHFLNYADLRRYTSGATRPKLTQESMKRIPVAVPRYGDPSLSLEIQRAIVARIELLLAELREIGTMHAAIDSDVGMVMESILRDVFAPEAMTGWNEDTLGNLVEINAHLVNPTLEQYKHLPHVHGGVMTELTCKLLPYNSAAQDEVTSGKFLFSPNSVLYSKIRPKLRKVVLVNFQGLCSADVYPLETTDPQVLTPEFLQWILVSPQFTDYAVGLSGRARIPKVNQEQLFAYRCRYPNIDQQHQLAQYILSVRDEIEELQGIQSADDQLLDQVEQAILEQAFRGEL